MKIQIRFGLALLALAAVVFVGTGSAFARSQNIDHHRGKLAEDLREAMSDRAPGTIPVIVTYKSAPDAVDLGKARKAGRVVRPLRSVNGLAARMSKRAIDVLARDPRVLSISPDREIHGS